MERTCTACGGAGQVISDPCKPCNGEGETSKKSRKLKLTFLELRKEVESDYQEKELGPNGLSPGDLYLFVSMVPHPIFEREATNIFCNVPISIVDASLGGSVDVPTVSGGKVKVKIPAGSQNGDQFRLNSKGMPTIRSTSFGDMIISLSVETPKNLSENQKRLLREFDEESSQKNNPESSGFF